MRPDDNQGGAPARSDSVGRRTRLRQYQVQLLERMQAAKSSAEVRVTQLGVMLGGTHCLLDLTQAGEIVSVGTIAPVPLTRDWYLGLANIRGNLVGVIDIGRYQGLPLTPLASETRIITFASTLGFNCGLLVSKVLGLRNVAEMSAEAASESGAPRFRDRDGHIWTRLDVTELIHDARFLQIGF